jgi:hypothetical protein
MSKENVPCHGEIDHVKETFILYRYAFIMSMPRDAFSNVQMDVYLVHADDYHNLWDIYHIHGDF